MSAGSFAVPYHIESSPGDRIVLRDGAWYLVSESEERELTRDETRTVREWMGEPKFMAAGGRSLNPEDATRADISAVKKGELPFYRGGGGPLTPGHAYFISSEMMAKFYGPVTEYRLKLRNPLFVSKDEWVRFDSIVLRFDPSPIQELEEEDYDSAVWATTTPLGERMFTVFALDGTAVAKPVSSKSDFVTISEEQFDALKPGQRIWMGVSSSWAETASEKEFEVGRSSYSKKYDIRSKRVYPIRDGKPDKRRAKWTLTKRGNGRVGLGQSDMPVMVKSFRVEARAANPGNAPVSANDLARKLKF